jgi:hypothetical protein
MNGCLDCWVDEWVDRSVDVGLVHRWIVGFCWADV